MIAYVVPDERCDIPNGMFGIDSAAFVLIVHSTRHEYDGMTFFIQGFNKPRIE